MEEGPGGDPVVVHITQSHIHTAAEIIAHIVVGFIVTMGVLALMLPETSMTDNAQVVVAVTGVKFIANYFIRRYFTGMR